MSPDRPGTILIVEDDEVVAETLTLYLAHAGYAVERVADGRIEVAARAEGARVVITVRNTGSTLDADQRARVFDRLYRTDPSRQRGTGGTGLGLAIVKQFVEAMGGEVGVESDATGVRFLVTLPAPQAADPRGAHLAEGA